MTIPPTTPDGAVYTIHASDGGAWIEDWPKTPDGGGVITAVARACWISLRSGPHEVRRPDGRMLARYVRGRRADLPPGGIVRLAVERADPATYPVAARR